jgi:hypothetical protein
MSDYGHIGYITEQHHASFSVTAKYKATTPLDLAYGDIYGPTRRRHWAVDNSSSSLLSRCHKVHVDQSHTTKGGATSSIKKIEVHDRAFGWEASVGAANRQLRWVHDQGIHRLLHWWRYMKSHLRSLHATLEWSCAAPDQTVLATAPTLTKEREMSSC